MWHVKGEELGKLLLDGLLIIENGRLVTHYYVHVGPERVHVLADGDLVLLVLSQYTSNRVIKSCTWSSSVVKELTGSSSWDRSGGGVDG